VASSEHCHQQTRVNPEVYTWLALAYKANGHVEQAKNTMQRALLFVTPWDDEFTKAEYSAAWNFMMSFIRFERVADLFAKSKSHMSPCIAKSGYSES
jgi:hypothetical protein